jgi:hypothetical protein
MVIPKSEAAREASKARVDDGYLMLISEVSPGAQVGCGNSTADYVQFGLRLQDSFEICTIYQRYENALYSARSLVRNP